MDWTVKNPQHAYWKKIKVDPLIRSINKTD